MENEVGSSFDTVKNDFYDVCPPHAQRCNCDDWLVDSQDQSSSNRGAFYTSSRTIWCKLLAQLISATAADIGVPTSNLYGWCDLTAVLGWLRNPPRLRDHCLCTVEPLLLLTSCQHPCKWHYVATTYFPADLASRGVFPQARLTDQELHSARLKLNI